MDDAAGAVYAADGVQDAGLSVYQVHDADVRAIKGAHEQNVALGQDCAFGLAVLVRMANKLVNAFELLRRLHIADGQGRHLSTEAVALFQ